MHENCRRKCPISHCFNPRPTGGGGAISSPPPPLVFLRYLLNQCRYHHQTCSTLSPNIFTLVLNGIRPPPASSLLSFSYSTSPAAQHALVRPWPPVQAPQRHGPNNLRNLPKKNQKKNLPRHVTTKHQLGGERVHSSVRHGLTNLQPGPAQAHGL